MYLTYFKMTDEISQNLSDISSFQLWLFIVPPGCAELVPEAADVVVIDGLPPELLLTRLKQQILHDKEGPWDH